MTDLPQRVTNLIRGDQLEAAVDALLEAAGDAAPELTAELAEHARSLATAKRERRRGLLSDQEAQRARTRVSFALQELVPQAAEAGGGFGALGRSAGGSRAKPETSSPAGAAPAGARSATVFISYNHQDSESADRLAKALEASGATVIIDHEAMRAGEKIEAFIQQSVNQADATVSLVSRKSLLSAWVALETIRSLDAMQADLDRQFIGCYLDDDFFRSDFRLEATDEIDERIAEIDRLLPRYSEKKLDTVDLNSEKSRLFDLRNNLGKVLLRLRDSLTLDIRGDEFDRGVARLVEAIGARR